MREGEKTGVKTVCAKYDISDQAYREWRYKARGIQPKKHHSPEERLKALKEAQKIGIKAVCAKYGITPQTYRSGAMKLTALNLGSTSLRRRNSRFLRKVVRKGFIGPAQFIVSIP